MLFYVLQVARCTKIIKPGTEEAKYVINVKQIAKVRTSQTHQLMKLWRSTVCLDSKSPAFLRKSIVCFFSVVWHSVQFVVGLGDRVAPTDIEEGMRVGCVLLPALTLLHLGAPHGHHPFEALLAGSILLLGKAEIAAGDRLSCRVLPSMMSRERWSNPTVVCCRVDRNKYQIQIPLPPKIDPTVTMMTVEEKPDVTYSDIGGCKEQIEKMREVVELPMLHPEKFVQLGIDPPKGVLCYGPPGATLQPPACLENLATREAPYTAEQSS